MKDATLIGTLQIITPQDEDLTLRIYIRDDNQFSFGDPIKWYPTLGDLLLSINELIA